MKNNFVASRPALQEIITEKTYVNSNSKPHKERKSMNKYNHIGKYKIFYKHIFCSSFHLLSDLKDICIKE